MNSFLTVSIVLASAALAFGAPISSAAPEQSGLYPALEESQHAATLHRAPRQLASSVLANAIGGRVAGQLPLIGGVLQAPVASLLQPSISSYLSSFTGGVVNRLGPYSELNQLQYWGRSLAQPQYSYQPYYRTLDAPLSLAQ